VPAVAGKAPVALEITDSRGQGVMTRRAALSSFCVFGFDLALPADAALGDYYVAATARRPGVPRAVLGRGEFGRRASR